MSKVKVNLDDVRHLKDWEVDVLIDLINHKDAQERWDKHCPFLHQWCPEYKDFEDPNDHDWEHKKEEHCAQFCGVLFPETNVPDCGKLKVESTVKMDDPTDTLSISFVFGVISKFPTTDEEFSVFPI